MAKKTALIVSAHAADFVWRCGGAIALHTEKGYEATVICLSLGERGESARLWKQKKATLEVVKKARRAEAERAAATLGVTSIQFFDQGDYPLEMDREARFRLVEIMRKVQPSFILSHSLEDPHNPDHSYTTRIVLECRATAQAMGHNPGETPLGAPQLYLFEPHQTEQCSWKPHVLLDITPVWEKKWSAIQCMTGQEHLWAYYANAAQNRASQFSLNSGGQLSGRPARYAEAFQTVFPQTLDEL